ncbi:MAG TPA: hypothetical protein VMF67_11265 [Rhizomicrobium sp.]|nr:hypothetical protein [Rhizomicrobium sp.]
MSALAEPVSINSSSPFMAGNSGREPASAIDLSAPFRGAIRQRSGNDPTLLPRQGWNQDDATEAQGLSLGPLRAGLGGMSGTHAHLASFRLQGVTVFGGSIGGSVDGRSANVVLSWPTNP